MNKQTKNMKKYLINFDELKRGDKLWEARWGEVEVVNLKTTEEYPISVKTKQGNTYTYTKEGKHMTVHNLPVLFKSNPFEAVSSEFPKMMLVSNNDNYWDTKEVLAFIPKMMYPYITINGNYKNAKEVEPKPAEVKLTLEDIAKLAGCKVEQLNIIK